jgi:hypothetical protein
VMGIKERVFSPLHCDISLEELIPKDNSYRRLEETLDLSSPRNWCAAGRHRPRDQSHPGASFEPLLAADEGIFSTTCLVIETCDSAHGRASGEE